MYSFAGNELPVTHAGVLLICGRCHALRGPVPGRTDGAEQLCLCAPRDMRVAQPRRGDHNTAMELCYCCGLALLRSGSKWSVWLCGPCKQWVMSLNRSAGRCLVPIGRHSLMNGVGLSGVAAPLEIDRFVRDSSALAASLEQLERYAHDVVVPRNMKVLGFPQAEHVALAQYLNAVEHSNLTQREAFERLQCWLAGRVDTR